MTESLASIGARHDTDKGWFHQYLEVYDTLLARHRTTARNVLEIGVWAGASLQLWAEAFPGADVYGVDPNPLVIPAHDRITVVQADAYRPMTVAAAFPGLFDIIVDDGPHTLESMLFVAEHYVRLLTPRGTLVIEDIADPSWIPLLAARLPSCLRRYAFAIDRRHAPRRCGEGWEGVASIMFVVDVTS